MNWTNKGKNHIFKLAREKTPLWNVTVRNVSLNKKGLKMHRWLLYTAWDLPRLSRHLQAKALWEIRCSSDRAEPTPAVFWDNLDEFSLRNNGKEREHIRYKLLWKRWGKWGKSACEIVWVSVCGLTACHPGGIKTAMELTLLSGSKGVNLSKSTPPWTVRLRKEITKCASIHRKEEASPFSRKVKWKETSFWFLILETKARWSFQRSNHLERSSHPPVSSAVIRPPVLQSDAQFHALKPCQICSTLGIKAMIFIPSRQSYSWSYNSTSKTRSPKGMLWYQSRPSSPVS